MEEEEEEEEEERSSPIHGNGSQVHEGCREMQSFRKSFTHAQILLEQNRLLINQIDRNHESKVPDNLSRNIALIRELNNNMNRVVDVYNDLSAAFSRSREPVREVNSGKHGNKRSRAERDAIID